MPTCPCILGSAGRATSNATTRTGRVYRGGPSGSAEAGALLFPLRLLFDPYKLTHVPLSWTTITQLVALNTPGYANGLLYLWANDTLALAHTGLTWRTNASVTLTSVLFSTFFGGSGRQWESEGGEGYFRRFKVCCPPSLLLLAIAHIGTLQVYGGPAQSNTSGPAVNATFEFTSAASRSHRPPTSGSPLLSFLASLALLVVVALQSAS